MPYLGQDSFMTGVFLSHTYKCTLCTHACTGVQYSVHVHRFVISLCAYSFILHSVGDPCMVALSPSNAYGPPRYGPLSVGTPSHSTPRLKSRHSLGGVSRKHNAHMNTQQAHLFIKRKRSDICANFFLFIYFLEMSSVGFSFLFEDNTGAHLSGWIVMDLFMNHS